MAVQYTSYKKRGTCQTDDEEGSINSDLPISASSSSETEEEDKAEIDFATNYLEHAVSTASSWFDSIQTENNDTKKPSSSLNSLIK